MIVCTSVDVKVRTEDIVFVKTKTSRQALNQKLGGVEGTQMGGVKTEMPSLLFVFICPP